MNTKIDYAALECDVHDYDGSCTDIPAAGLVWIRARPPVIQDLIKRFPPSCILRTRRPLCCMPAGAYCRVASYYEFDAQPPALSVFWTDGQLHLIAPTDMDSVEIVKHWHGLTPTRMMQLLGSPA